MLQYRIAADVVLADRPRIVKCSIIQGALTAELELFALPDLWCETV